MQRIACSGCKAESYLGPGVTILCQRCLAAKDARIKELEGQVSGHAGEMIALVCRAAKERDQLKQERNDAVDKREGALMRIDGLQVQLQAKEQELERVKGERDAAVRSKNDCVIDLYRRLDKLDELNHDLKQAHAEVLREAVWAMEWVVEEGKSGPAGFSGYQRARAFLATHEGKP